MKAVFLAWWHGGGLGWLVAGLIAGYFVYASDVEVFAMIGSATTLLIAVVCLGKAVMVLGEKIQDRKYAAMSKKQPQK